MYKSFYFFIVALSLAFIGGSSEVTKADDYYKGKNIRFIVGFAAGGGYDAYTRTVARHISRHIPGNPSTSVENMDGAGSVIAANYMYNKAGKDGLTVGIWNSHNVFSHMMGDPSLRIDG